MINVATDAATNVDQDSSTLNAQLTQMDNTNSVDVWFQYGQGSFTDSTNPVTLSSTGGVSSVVSSLDSGTQYQFRAVAEADDGTTDYGGTYTFTTDDPIIDDFETYTAGSNSDLMNNYNGGSADYSYFQATTSESSSGSQSLEYAYEDSTQNIASHRGDGLNAYVDNGDTFRYDFKLNSMSGGQRIWVFYSMDSYQFGGQHYHVVIDSGDALLRRGDDWNYYSIASVDVSSYPDGTWWTAEVTWEGSTHELTIYDSNGNQVGSDSGTDGTFSYDGTIGFGIDHTGNYIDNVRLAN